jgi:hypothetical protein
MQASSRQRVILGALLAVLVGVVTWQLQPWGPTPVPATSGQTSPGTTPGRRGQNLVPTEPMDVALDRLEAGGPEPDVGGRSPFRYGTAAPVAEPDEPAPHPPPDPAAGSTAPPSPAGPVGPPPPPPIPFKFIGIVSSASTGGKVAVLSDGKFVYHGREGDIIDGRFRVVRIGEESIQLEYFDGRGRQTIRLTGS